MPSRITVKKDLVEALEELYQALEFRDNNKLVVLFGIDTLEKMDQFKQDVEKLGDDQMEEVSWSAFYDMIELADTLPPTAIMSESEKNLCDVRSALARILQHIPEYLQDDSHQKLYIRGTGKVIEWLDGRINAQRTYYKRMNIEK